VKYCTLISIALAEVQQRVGNDDPPFSDGKFSLDASSCKNNCCLPTDALRAISRDAELTAIHVFSSRPKSIVAKTSNVNRRATMPNSTTAWPRRRGRVQILAKSERSVLRSAC
jgi:hypothetical protein